MPELPLEAWIGFGAIAFAAVLAVLHTLASAVKAESQIHDTKIKARDLQVKYAAELAALEARKNLNRQVDVVGQGTIEQAMRKAA